ncbi:MAG TPA: phosphoribosyltransferase [Nocardioidaceae bacterium]|jgi:putative phosphoribosyl transferase
MFRDRQEAGRRLAALLRHLAGPDTVVLGLPRGGVPVAFEVAEELRAPLDVVVVRKLGVPYQPELAMGAIGEEGVRVVNDEVLAMAGLTPADVARVEEVERTELERRSERFRAGRERVSLKGCTAVIVDDGVATGSTALAACQVVRAAGAERVVLAVPVAPPDVAERFENVADEVVCAETPGGFFAIGQFYGDFSPTPDEEVASLLARARADHAQAVDEGVEVEVLVGAEAPRLPGTLTVPAAARMVVVFAHGSGSSRLSPRNRYVASVLHAAGIGTLLFDLLTPDEEVDRSTVFDIGLLAERLTAATAWLRGQPPAENLRVGYFGASTGAGAALWAASAPGADVAAVVSRGGRPDLAMRRLADVRAPTLLIVGGRDDQVLAFNEEARRHLRCENRLSVVPGATHLFEEPGALEQVAQLARDWFSDRC